MRRNLRFWTRFTWENVEAELIIVAVFLVIGAVTGDYIWSDGGSGLADFAALAPFYLIISAVLCVMMISPGCQTLYIPLLIANGEPRKNIFWGFQYHRFLLIAVTSAVSALVWSLVPSEISDACLSCLPMIVLGLVISSSLGNLLGSMYVKWKWAGVVVMVLLFGMCGGLVGWMGSTGGFEITGMSLFVLGMATYAPSWQMTAAAAALLAVDLGIQWLLLRRREVKL